MRTIFVLLLAIMTATLTYGQNKLQADVQKTKLEWLGEKVLGKHTGTIQLQSGWLTWNNNRITAGEFLIDMKTIRDDDGLTNLENHLRSDDFFSVEKFPVSKLVITGSDSFEKGTATVKGNLTIKGITNPIEFTAAVQKKDDGTWFYSNIIVDRTKYNVRYGSGKFFDNLGDKIIYDEFKLKVTLLVK
ncbi:MAG TPA: YceI family protein [Bacteroidales bacterium]|nr:YceI family protein [Bacteroidales bacterium]HRR92377.1 YceI family protein [Bacteroidales bacterium]HRT89456.1 YceI family protein [Bacteroidales bacterium]